MNRILEYFTGMGALTDQVIASDLLISAKSGVRNYAMALTEAGTPEIKAMLTRQLEDAIDLHERISTYMIERGWYRPWNMKEQFQLDIQNLEIALKAPML